MYVISLFIDLLRKKIVNEHPLQIRIYICCEDCFFF